ncbi:hypothetical protein [Pseudoduganella violaceinigra]|uniref:hypothetical protein n=1 Tax=Pseudoduganella violaceinigra TaxID=246602 RepID=UPI0012B5DCDA|nr:hypothetical protein [Pseudoduganella violaceinigra]
MKRLLLACGLGIFAISISAHSQTPVETVVVPAQKDVNPLYLGNDEILEFVGDYQLANGMTLLLSKQGSRMFGQVGSLPRHELISTGLRKFDAVDGKLSVHIKYTWDGQITGKVAYVASSRSTGALPVLVEFALR